MHVAIWILMLLLIGLWSLAAWGLAALLGMDAGWVDRVQGWLVDWPPGDWLDLWVPGWMMAMQASLDALQAVLAWLGGAAPILVWGLWSLGLLMLVGLGALLSLIVVLVRRSTAPSPPPAAATAG
jgi:hypothetical protein